MNLSLSILSPVVGHRYQLQRSPDMAPDSWQNVGDAYPGDGGAIGHVLPIMAGCDQPFYRILITR